MAITSGDWKNEPRSAPQSQEKRALALQHLTEAKRIASQFGPTSMLAKIETALADLVRS